MTFTLGRLQAALGIFLSAVITLWLILATAPIEAQTGAATDSDTRLWILRSQSLQALDAGNGSAQTTIPVFDATALALDSQGNVWTFSDGFLRSHSDDGTLLLERVHPQTAADFALKLFVQRDAGLVWLVQSRAVHIFNLDGDAQQSLSTDETIVGADLDRDNNRLWLAERFRLSAVDSTATQTVSVDFAISQALYALTYDASIQQTWVVSGRELHRYNVDGERVFRSSADSRYLISHLQADGEGGLWAADQHLLAHMDDEGRTDFVSRAFPNLNIFQLFTNRITGIAVDPEDQSLWIIAQDVLNRFSPDGNLLQSIAINNNAPNNGGHVRDIALFRPPPATLTIVAPADGSALNDNRPTVILNYQGQAAADLQSVILNANGALLDSSCSLNSSEQISCSLTTPLPEGNITLDAGLKNEADQELQADPVFIRIDTLAPQIILELPADNSTVNQTPINVIGEVNESATLLINGQPTLLNNLRFNAQQPLNEGSNTLSIEATDTVGNRSTVSRTVILDTQAPSPLLSNQVLIETAEEGFIAVSAAAGSAEPGSTVVIVNQRTGVRVNAQVAADGSFSAQIAAETADPISLTVVDAAGNQSDTLGLTAPDNGLPPVPDAVAPPLVMTQTTTMAEASAFLYQGATPVQTGVAAETIEERRAAVIRGRVLDADGAPLPGVTVSIQGQAQFGQTLSRRDGAFDLAVNGGSELTVNYRKDGFLPVQRQVEVPWQDFVIAEDAMLIALDTAMTSVDLANAVDAQIAQGSMQSDADGQRQATLMFPPGTSATMTMADGSVQPLTTLSVRATEYTVGENGQERMPGELPATSGYTYAVELSVDEAIAAGAEQVTFSQPIPMYVDNFLDFPVGEPVPLGYYDRQKSAWIPSDDGRIIQIIDKQNGQAVLDVSGNGNPADGAELSALGITALELQKLAEMYDTGKSLWRSPIPHFTPWDCNWPFGPPEDAAPPPDEPPQTPTENDPDTEDRDDCEGCMIEPQGQVLGEELPIVATPYSLVYRSDRSLGYRAAREIDIPLSGETVPASLQAIDLEIMVAGQTFKRSFPAQPNQNFTYVWDGKDAYGRDVLGVQTATIKIDYRYQVVYFSSAGNFRRSFAQAAGGSGGGGRGGARVIGQRGNQNISVSRSWQTEVTGQFLSGDNAIGGWSFNVHHQYDARSGLLFKGDGTRRSAKTLGNKIETFFDGRQLSIPLNITLNRAGGIYIDKDGSLFYTDPTAHTLVRQDADGNAGIIAGALLRPGFSGDGGPLSRARFNRPQGITQGPDGSFFIADSGNRRIRRVDPDGIIRTYAGGGAQNYQDGLPALDVRLPINYIAVDKDGVVYLTSDNTVRKVGLDGIIETIAGSTQAGFAGDGGQAINALLNRPTGINVDTAGNLYITDAGNARIRRIDPQGVISTVIGNGTPGFSGDGGPAIAASISGNLLGAIAIDAEGNLYLADNANHRVRVVNAEGIIATLSGTGEKAAGGDDGPAALAQLDTPDHLTIDPLGNIYLTDFSNFRVRRILLASQQLLDASEFSVASKDGRELYVFSNRARHVRTEDTFTGTALYSFEYNEESRLSGIRDAYGRLTQIDYDSNGSPQRITDPENRPTTLLIDNRGYLVELKPPHTASLDAYLMQYSNEGLLLSYTDRRGLENRFEYDQRGLLLRDINAGGGGWQLSRTQQGRGYTTSMTTAEGRRLSFSVEPLAEGGRRQVNTRADGTTEVREFTSEGKEITRRADGTVMTLREGADPRFGSDAPLIESFTISTPGGLSSQSRYERFVAKNPPNNPFFDIEEVLEIDGKTTRRNYKAQERTYITTTPEGRTYSDTVTFENRPSVSTTSGLASLFYEYDGAGRLTSLTAVDGEETRRTELSYYETVPFEANSGQEHQSGYLASITDALGRTTSFNYDTQGLLLNQTLFDGRIIGFGYDANDNLTALTPPGKPSHTFEYNNFNLESAYIPPEIQHDSNLPSSFFDPRTRYSYNLDQELERIALADGRTIEYRRNNLGQLIGQDLSRGTYGYAYDSTSGRLNTVTAPGDGGQLLLDYDGFLLTRWTWEGEINGRVQRNYDNSMRIREYVVDADEQFSVDLEYDRDDLLLRAGELQIQRAAQRGGLITGTTFDDIETRHEYNGFAEPVSMQATQRSLMLYNTSYRRDKLGRITEKNETILGQQTQESYAYDESGRLTRVTRNGQETVYTYDDNGNRLSRSINGAQQETGSYDDQDRLIRYGDVDYRYGENGELQNTSGPAKTAAYKYDELGNLLEVALQDGTNIEYIIDGYDRRIGKRINGVLTQSWLYQDQLNPIAELDQNGSIRSFFIYAEKSNVPAYMIRDGMSYRILSDHLGSPRLVVETESGDVVQQMEYDAFGKILQDTNPGFHPFGFAGGLYDSDTGLVRFGARDYDPNTGRWTSKDPFRFTPKQANLYGYSFNDPVNMRDPSGLFGLAGGIYGAISGGIGGYISGGWQGALAGAGAGAIVGAVNPFGANAAGAAAGAGVASLIGQGAGNAVAGKDVTDPCNYDFLAAAGAAAGGAVGGPLGNALGRYIPPYRYPIIGRPLNAPGISNAPGNTVGAIVEGAAVGTGELGGQQL